MEPDLQAKFDALEELIQDGAERRKQNWGRWQYISALLMFLVGGSGTNAGYQYFSVTSTIDETLRKHREECARTHSTFNSRILKLEHDREMEVRERESEFRAFVRDIRNGKVKP